MMEEIPASIYRRRISHADIKISTSPTIRNKWTGSSFSVRGAVKIDLTSVQIFRIA
jgi:hypothetical protein